MKIFLSGKVDEENGKWRDWVLGTDFTAIGIPIPRWCVRTVLPDYGSTNNILPWPVRKKVVLDTHDYTGPYRQIVIDDHEAEHLGYFHRITAAGQHGQFYEGEQKVIVDRCKQAIDDSDIIFAFINSQDCFGTICEIGYAAGKGKFIIVAVGIEYFGNVNPCYMGQVNTPELWFACKMAQICQYQQSNEVEREFIISTLLNGISTRTTWIPQKLSLINEAALSFNMIQKWSSDPRVRDEAAKMYAKIQKGNQ